MVLLHPRPDLCLVDHRFSASSLLMLEDIHVLQCRYDVIWYNERLLSKIIDGQCLLRRRGQYRARKGLRPVVHVSQTTEVGKRCEVLADKT